MCHGIRKMELFDEGLWKDREGFGRGELGILVASLPDIKSFKKA